MAVDRTIISPRVVRVSVENGIQAMAAKAHMGIRIIHMRTKINIYTTNQITAVKWSVKFKL